ncbi:MAG: phosphatase PAP2 family protein [Candidatus Paceibacterota bacterium]
MLNSLIYFCAVILPWILGIGLAGYFFVTKKKIAAVRLIGLSFLGAIIAWFLASLYKYNFPSPRPFEIYDNLKPLFITGRGDAFPSGHATFFGALAMGVFLQNHPSTSLRARIFDLVFIIGATLIAIARVLANVHSLLDVIAGLIWGALVSIIVWLIYNKIYPK